MQSHRSRVFGGVLVGIAALAHASSVYAAPDRKVAAQSPAAAAGAQSAPAADTPAAQSQPPTEGRAGAAEPTEEQKQTATRHFSEGMAAFDKGTDLLEDHKTDDANASFVRALASFRASYQNVASPNSHLMVARCLARLRRTPEAFAEFSSAMAEAESYGDKYASALDAAKVEREDLRAQVGLLKVTLLKAPPHTEVRANSRVITPEELEGQVAVMPGKAEIVAITPAGTQVTRSVEVDAGSTAAVTLALEDAKPAPPPPVAAPERKDTGRETRREAAYYAGALGVAGVLTGTGLAIFGGKGMGDFAALSFVVGGLGIGAGVVLYVTSAPPKPKAATTARLGPSRTWVTVGPGSVSVSGEF